MAEKQDFELDDLNVFDDEQKQVYIRMLRHIEDKAADKAKETLEDMGLSEDDLRLAPRDRAHMADQKRLETMKGIWKNNGFIDGASDRLTIQDLIKKDQAAREKMMKDGFSTDHPLLIPRVISEIVREAIEPALNLTPLLQNINVGPDFMGTSIVFPAWGAIHAADIPEGGEYPERELELAGEVTATIGKSGVAVKMTDEMLRFSQFDVMSRHLSAAGRALARHKEKKVADMLLASDNVVFDNSGAGSKSTTGRNAHGAYNGTLSLDDMFYAWATMVVTGFTPNAMIMHPLAWQVFANEGIARAFGFHNGLQDLMWQLAQGSAGNAGQWRIGGLHQETRVTNPGNVASTFTRVPSVSPTSGLNIIVSPFMNFTASTNRTDILLVDTSELGVIVTNEGVMTEEWRDPSVDIQKVKLRERYAVSSINSYKGVALLKDINVGEPSVDFRDKVTANIDVTGLTNPLTGDFEVNQDV